MYDYGDHGDYDRYPDYDGPRGGRNRSGYGYQYHCGGFASYDGPCGASDCGDCRNGAPPWEEQDEEDDVEVREVSVATYHIAIKARGFIRPGDMVIRWSGFTYEKGGRRTGYTQPKEAVVARAPGTQGHSPETWSMYLTLWVKQNAERRSRRNRR